MLDLTPSQIIHYEEAATALRAEQSKMQIMNLQAAIVSSFGDGKGASEWQEALDQMINGTQHEED